MFYTNHQTHYHTWTPTRPHLFFIPCICSALWVWRSSPGLFYDSCVIGFGPLLDDLPVLFCSGCVSIGPPAVACDILVSAWLVLPQCSSYGPLQTGSRHSGDRDQVLHLHRGSGSLRNTRSPTQRSGFLRQDAPLPPAPPPSHRYSPLALKLPPQHHHSGAAPNTVTESIMPAKVPKFTKHSKRNACITRFFNPCELAPFPANTLYDSPCVLPDE